MLSWRLITNRGSQKVGKIVFQQAINFPVHCHANAVVVVVIVVVVIAVVVSISNKIQQ